MSILLECHVSSGTDDVRFYIYAILDFVRVSARVALFGVKIILFLFKLREWGATAVRIVVLGFNKSRRVSALLRSCFIIQVG